MTTRYVFVDPTDYKTDVNVAEELMKKMAVSEKKSSSKSQKKREDPSANPCNFTNEFKAMIPMINCGIDTGAIHSIVGKRGPPGVNGVISPYKYYNDATAANNSILPTVEAGNNVNNRNESTILNGVNNSIDANGSTVLNGENGKIHPGAYGSTILNGNRCEIYGYDCMIYGGVNNKIVANISFVPSGTSIISGNSITTKLSNTAVAQNLQNTGGRIESVTNATRLPTDPTYFQLTADHHHVFNNDGTILSFRLPDRANPTIAIGQIYELRSLLKGPGPAPVPVSITLPSDVILRSVDNLSDAGGPGDVTVAYNFANLRILLRAQDLLNDFWVIINQI